MVNDDENMRGMPRPAARALERLRAGYAWKIEQASLKAAIAMTEARAARAMLLHLVNIKTDDIDAMAREIKQQFFDGCQSRDTRELERLSFSLGLFYRYITLK